MPAPGRRPSFEPADPAHSAGAAVSLTVSCAPGAVGNSIGSAGGRRAPCGRGAGEIPQGVQNPAMSSMHPAGREPKQSLTNTGRSDLVALIIADNPQVETYLSRFEQMGHWGGHAPGNFFRMDRVDYLDGEEDDDQPAPPPFPQTRGFRPPTGLPACSRKRKTPSGLPGVGKPWQSPKGGSTRPRAKEISIELGRLLRNTPTGIGRPSVNLELGPTTAPGKKRVARFKAIRAQKWEICSSFLSGTGTVSRRRPRPDHVHAGGTSHAFRPAKPTAHQLGTADLDYPPGWLTIRRPRRIVCTITESNKWGFPLTRKKFSARPI